MNVVTGRHWDMQANVAGISMMGSSAPRVAIVHEWLVTYAGSEKVLEAMLQVFPEADIFCALDFLPEQFRGNFKNKKIRTSFIQRIPFARHIHRYLLALMPMAVEQHDLSAYDIVISNSHAVAKGCLTTASQLHICYCYTPIRYAWDLHFQYLAESNLLWGLRSIMARWMLHRIRIWDSRTPLLVDSFIACSEYIARRIAKTYRRHASVIYPNVDVEKFQLGQQDGGFYITASRIVPYKQIPLIIDAFRKMPSRELIVIGAGPLLGECIASAPPNVKILGYQPDDVLRANLMRARAFIFAAEEDFGIAPVEAQACGTPVIAFGRGGATETVIAGETGLFFHEQTREAIIKAVEEFEDCQEKFDRNRIRQNAERFSTTRFCAEFREFVFKRWEAHCQLTQFKG
jgi:glycosyltransferase involved in cell wall biosynthesis